MIDIQTDVQALALKAGVIVEEVEGSGITYWTNGDYLEALTNFARLVLELPLTEDIDWRNTK
jgi:hypothetical protein